MADQKKIMGNKKESDVIKTPRAVIARMLNHPDTWEVLNARSFSMQIRVALEPSEYDLARSEASRLKKWTQSSYQRFLF